MNRLYFLVPAAMSVLAVLHLPYGYYQLLRLVVVSCAGLIAWGGWQRRSHIYVIAFGMLALIYNPIFPLRFERELWAWINIGTAIEFIGAMFLLERSERQRGKNNGPTAREIWRS